MTPDDAISHELIRQTISCYAHHVDDGHFEALSQLFTADGTLVIDRFDEATFALEGRDAIASYLARSAAERAADPRRGPYRRHHVSSIGVTLEDATRATGLCYFMAVMAHGPDHWGRYEDTYRFDGRWRFAHRHVRVDGRIRREVST